MEVNKKAVILIGFILLGTLWVFQRKIVDNRITFPLTVLPNGVEQTEVTLTLRTVGDMEYDDGSSVRTFDTGSSEIIFQIDPISISLKGALRTKMVTEAKYQGDLKDGYDLAVMYWYIAMSNTFIANVYVEGKKVGECQLLVEPWIQAPDGTRWQSTYGRTGDEVIWFSGQSVLGLPFTKLPSGSVAYAYWYIRWDSKDTVGPYVDLSEYREKTSIAVKIETVHKWTMLYFKPSLLMKVNLGEQSKTMIDVKTLGELIPTGTETERTITLNTVIVYVTRTSIVEIVYIYNKTITETVITTLTSIPPPIPIPDFWKMFVDWAKSLLPEWLRSYWWAVLIVVSITIILFLRWLLRPKVEIKS